MGNYHEIEPEFIQRTLQLIDQYYAILDQFPFEKQFNYTLTINCLLGLIVMPKEKVISYVSTERLTNELLVRIGAPSLVISKKISTVRELIQSLRNAIAHFEIHVISDDDQNRIDWLEFSDSKNGVNPVARFRANEIQPFLRYYASSLLQNMAINRGP